MAGGLSRDLALRIGVAARVLPGGEVSRLMAVLVEALGMPLTAQKLRRISVRQLGTCGEQAYRDASLPQLKLAADYLWGRRPIDVVEPALPAVESRQILARSLRVAVASNSGEKLDGRFTDCRRFLVYQVSAQEIRLVELRTPALGGSMVERAALLEDCQLLLALDLGSRAAARAMHAGIHPLAVDRVEPARAALGRVQSVLGGMPPPWLAKAAGMGGEWRVRRHGT